MEGSYFLHPFSEGKDEDQRIASPNDDLTHLLFVVPEVVG